MKTTHIKAHTRGHTFNQAALKREEKIPLWEKIVDTPSSTSWKNTRYEDVGDDTQSNERVIIWKNPDKTWRMSEGYAAYPNKGAATSAAKKYMRNNP
jgi:hypothetical protein